MDQRRADFAARLRDISLQSDSITSLAKQLLASYHDGLAEAYMEEWRSFQKSTDDPNKVKALIYLLNEVIQQRGRERCLDILDVVHPVLTQAFYDVSQRFQVIAPSCQRVVAILKERGCCGTDEAAYVAYQQALWGIQPPPAAKRARRTLGEDEEKQNLEGEEMVGFDAEEPTSDDDIDVGEFGFVRDVEETVNCCKKYSALIDSKYTTRRSLQFQIERFVEEGGMQRSPEDRASQIAEGKRKQITGLMVKEWRARVNLQEEYRELMGQLQSRLDLTVHRLNQVAMQKAVVQNARLHSF
eukprot:GHVS01042918.1.p2 GENE.GHVS01042918.1~~GHVS01042918.1.p2  ORF type:complete len:299 (-),score=49.78 GHVS01042918.1:1223-2119(-)